MYVAPTSATTTHGTIHSYAHSENAICACFCVFISSVPNPSIFNEIAHFWWLFVLGIFILVLRIFKHIISLVALITPTRWDLRRIEMASAWFIPSNLNLRPALLCAVLISLVLQVLFLVLHSRSHICRRSDFDFKIPNLRPFLQVLRRFRCCTTT